MKNIKYFLAVSAILFACGSAHAQFNFKLPSVGNMDTNKLLNNAKNLQDIDQPREIEIGQQFAAVLLGARPLYADQRAQRYINDLGRYLASQSERPDLPWTFAVIDDPSFNAFSTPGGYVFVTSGLLQQLHNESELAGVLGHEIGHIIHKHYLKAVKVQARAAMVADNIHTNSQLSATLLNLAKQAFTKGLDRDDEFDADAVGVVIAARGGFDPFGLPSALQILEQHTAQGNGFSLAFQTHPEPSARIERLEALIQNRFDNFNGAVGPAPMQRLKEY
jgi:predicted Zn-dependent protease